jgi:DNA-binding XRE family transcriptional regulator
MADHKSPTPEQIRKARKSAGLTQQEAGELVGASRRAWQSWEAGDNPMHPGLWELFQIKAEIVA